jgi:outer membrane receptor for ferrienterochelin and colicin
MLVITTGFTMNTFAEDHTTKNPEEIEKMFINGTKQELTLQEVDASVELFGEERMDAEHIVDLTDVLLRVPNVASSGSSGSITTRDVAGIDQTSGELSLVAGGTSSRILVSRTFGVGIDYSF